MTSLRQALADYLAMRRAMGYRLARAEKLLGQFLTYLEERRETRLRTRTALAWGCGSSSSATRRVSASGMARVT